MRRQFCGDYWGKSGIVRESESFRGITLMVIAGFWAGSIIVGVLVAFPMLLSGGTVLFVVRAEHRARLGMAGSPGVSRMCHVGR